MAGIFEGIYKAINIVRYAPYFSDRDSGYDRLEDKTPECYRSDFKAALAYFRARHQALNDEAQNGYVRWLEQEARTKRGLRARNVASLRWADVHLGLNQKDGNRVTVSIEAVRGLLMLYRHTCPQEEFLFPGRSNGHVSPQTVRGLVKKVGCAAGTLQTVKPHGLRKTFPTLQWAEGADLLELQDNLGHSDLTTTVVYVDRRAGYKPRRKARAS